MNGNHPPALALDGAGGTYYHSASQDFPWLQVDLGKAVWVTGASVHSRSGVGRFPYTEVRVGGADESGGVTDGSERFCRNPLCFMTGMTPQ